LCRALRDGPRLPQGLRPRAVDSTTVQGPARTGTEWRIHYALDLTTLTCDWCELTDAHGGGRLERTPMRKGDVLLADRHYLRPAAVLAAPDVLELYRVRWQIDLAFKRHKQLLKVGRLPQTHAQAAHSWIMAKLVIALLLETLYRNARAISPWGYRFHALARVPQ